MIDVAICLELPTRAEHPLKWCIVGGVIYDGGPLWRLAGAYCAGRVWHGRPRSEQAWDAQAAWPEQRLMGLSLKSAKQQASTGWRATDIVQCGATGESGGWHLSEDVGGSDDDEAERLPSEYECSGMGRDVELK